MITALVAVALLPGMAQDQVKAAPIVSKMFARYANAKSLVGSIQMTVTTPYGVRTIDTKIQYERPSRLYLWQKCNVTVPVFGLITSDGTLFSYDNPDPDRLSKARLIESVMHNGAAQTVGEMFSAGSLGMPDHANPVRIAIARIDDLKYMRNQWATLQFAGRVTVGSVQANHIIGAYREYGLADVSGSYEMDVTDDGDLVRYAFHQTVAPPAGSPASIQSFAVDTVWICAFQTNAKVDPSLFTVVK